jgi:lysophospholipase L1-like esterase
MNQAMTSLFIGDSITDGFPFSELLPGKDIVNKGISGASSREILDRFNAEWVQDNPSRVFICLGTNDLARGVDDDSITGNLSSLVSHTREYLQPGAPRIYLTSLFPTLSNPSRPNDRIDRLNNRIHQLALSHGEPYLHLNVFFKDGENRLMPGFTDDGLHLNREGYKLWAGLIESLV